MKEVLHMSTSPDRLLTPWSTSKWHEVNLVIQYF